MFGYSIWFSSNCNVIGISVSIDERHPSSIDSQSTESVGEMSIWQIARPINEESMRWPMKPPTADSAVECAMETALDGRLVRFFHRPHWQFACPFAFSNQTIYFWDQSALPIGWFSDGTTRPIRWLTGQIGFKRGNTNPPALRDERSNSMEKRITRFTDGPSQLIENSWLVTIFHWFIRIICFAR